MDLKIALGPLHFSATSWEEHDTWQFMRKDHGQLLHFSNHKGPPESRLSVDGITGGQSATSTQTLDIGTEVINI